MSKIKLHYPIATAIETTIRLHLPPKPGDIVLVFDPDSIFIGNFTVLSAIDNDSPCGMQFRAPITINGTKIYHWTYAYKVPEGYANVETSND